MAFLEVSDRNKKFAQVSNIAPGTYDCESRFLHERPQSTSRL
jgi:hypothetical protein